MFNRMYNKMDNDTFRKEVKTYIKEMMDKESFDYFLDLYAISEVLNKRKIAKRYTESFVQKIDPEMQAVAEKCILESKIAQANYVTKFILGLSREIDCGGVLEKKVIVLDIVINCLGNLFEKNGIKKEYVPKTIEWANTSLREDRKKALGIKPMVPGFSAIVAGKSEAELDCDNCTQLGRPVCILNGCVVQHTAGIMFDQRQETTTPKGRNIVSVTNVPKDFDDIKINLNALVGHYSKNK